MTDNDCVGCIYYRPYSKREGSNEWECEWGMSIAYECINDGHSKKLKPCPFCGRSLERHTEGYGVDKVAYRHPLDTSRVPCFLADMWFFESEDEMIRWNKRAKQEEGLE